MKSAVNILVKERNRMPLKIKQILFTFLQADLQVLHVRCMGI